MASPSPMEIGIIEEAVSGRPPVVPTTNRTCCEISVRSAARAGTIGCRRLGIDNRIRLPQALGHLAPITMIALMPSVLVGNATTQARCASELLFLLRAGPGY